MPLRYRILEAVCVRGWSKIQVFFFPFFWDQFCHCCLVGAKYKSFMYHYLFLKLIQFREVASLWCLYLELSKEFSFCFVSFLYLIVGSFLQLIIASLIVNILVLTFT